MTQPTDAQAFTRLTLALSTQYIIERELGGGYGLDPAAFRVVP